MRIGIDALGLQSPHSRGRGIGRYGRSLVAELGRRAPDSRFLLYAHTGHPTDGIPVGSNIEIRSMPEAATPRAAAQRLADENPDELDALLVLSPFEVGLDYATPARPLRRLPLLAVVYDLVPFLFQ